MVFYFLHIIRWPKMYCLRFCAKKFEKRQSSYRYLSFEKKKNALIFVRISRISLILEYLNHKNYKIKREYTRRKRWKKEKKKNTEIKNRQSKSMQIVFFCAQYLSSLSLYIGSNIRVIWRNGKKNLFVVYIFELQNLHICVEKTVLQNFAKKKIEKRGKIAI